MAQHLGAPVALTENSYSVSSPYIGQVTTPVIPVTRDPSLFLESRGIHMAYMQCTRANVCTLTVNKNETGINYRGILYNGD